VKSVGRRCNLGQFFRPASARAIEDDFVFVAELQALLGDGEGIEDATERFVAAFGTGKDDDGNFHSLFCSCWFVILPPVLCAALVTSLAWCDCESGHNFVGYPQIGVKL